MGKHAQAEVRKYTRAWCKDHPEFSATCTCRDYVGAHREITMDRPVLDAIWRTFLSGNSR